MFFVMVKDNENRFSESEHWGDGWGWAMFGAKPTHNESPNKEFCQLSQPYEKILNGYMLINIQLCLNRY
ncbi:hypothetical protein JCM19231_1285 [Vibrio ishigakensis]|uniref:Uncharacterized protein n=1 Tax=Vibrio ishigakensis TaxID=1481914 RepID=A0A0B8NSW5_9VIBR|nr:hypothetical protein JCM19231_1285 [Vibrio ishigakensis]